MIYVHGRLTLAAFIALVAPITMAQVPSQPAAVATQQSWLKERANDRETIKYYERSLRDPEGFKSDFYQYENLGRLGMPRLTVSVPIDYSIDKSVKGKTALIPQEVGFAIWACTCLDIDAKQAGAWGHQNARSRNSSKCRKANW